MAVDQFKNASRMDQVVVGAGVLAFVLSLFHVFVVSVSGPGSSLIGSLGSRGAANAWHNWGVFGMLLILAATAVAAVRLLAPASLPQLPLGVNLATLALSALGFLSLLIAWFHNTDSVTIEGIKISVHLGVFGYLLLLASLAQSVAAFLLFRQSGEAVPDFQAMAAQRRAGAPAGAPGYGAPTGSYAPPTTTPAGDFTLDDNPPAPPTSSV